MTIGLSLIAVQYWGKGDILAVERIFAFVTKVTTVISLIFTLSALLLSGMLLAVYFIISLDEIVKIPVVYLNYKKYRWGKDLTVKSE